jgi:cytochrome P450
MSGKLKIHVDQDKCQGHARCKSLAPELFELDEYGKENRHAAFGLGIHRCVGSNLARMEMQVAIEEWLKRIPDFRLDPAGRVTWSEGTVRGPRRLPVLFGKAS